jgi:hypothetical protein
MRHELKFAPTTSRQHHHHEEGAFPGPLVAAVRHRDPLGLTLRNLFSVTGGTAKAVSGKLL